MVKVRWIAAIALSLVVAAPATAVTATQHDFQCMTAMTIAFALAKNAGGAFNLGGFNGTLYFAGKIYGRDPHADLAAIGQGLPGITAQNAKAIMPECARELSERGAEMSAAGQRLKSAGK